MRCESRFSFAYVTRMKRGRVSGLSKDLTTEQTFGIIISNIPLK